MFTELLRRLPDLELATGDPLPRRASNFVSGLEAMPVIFAPVPAVPATVGSYPGPDMGADWEVVVEGYS
jgi:hypothetical protein